MKEQECTDPEVGRLLHAYEMGALAEDDAKSFEVHLLRCVHCFTEVQVFDRHTTLLRSDPEVRSEVGRHSGRVVERLSFSERLRKYLWPDVPLLFRPAVSILIVLLLIYPAYLGLTSGPSNHIAAVSSISLLPHRSASGPAVDIPQGRALVLSFACPGVVPGAEYEVTIIGRSQNVVYHTSSFRDFDSFEIGRLLVPTGVLGSGSYTLKVVGQGEDSEEIAQQYSFNIAVVR